MATSSWDRLSEALSKTRSSTSRWIKLKSGEKVDGAVLGEPFVWEAHWDGSRFRLCTGDQCKRCGSTDVDEVTTRIAVNFAVRTGTGWKLKILERAASLFKKLLAIAAEHDRNQWTFVIERTGQADDATAIESISAGSEIGKQDRKVLDGLPLIDLEKLYGNRT